MDTGVSQVSGPDLGDVACPQCGEVGTLEVQSLLTIDEIYKFRREASSVDFSCDTALDAAKRWVSVI